MISFVIPAYNEAALVGGCVKSIQRALRIRNMVGEIIIVDNGSTDDTAEIARSFGVKVVSQPTKGLTHARKAGHIAAQRDLVAHIDADNVMRPQWLDVVLAAMKDPAVVAVSGPLYYADLSFAKRATATAFYCVARLAHRILPMIQGGNFVMRKEAYWLMGGFDTSITFYGDDTDIAKRLARIGKVRFVPAMWIQSSGRRMRAEGLAATGLRYIANYLSVHLLGRPWSENHNDIRH